MKKQLVTILSLLMVLSAGLVANARSIQTRFDLQANLNVFSLDPRLGLKNVESGIVNVSYDLHDQKQNLITLELYRKFHCPEGVYCAQVMPAPYRVTVPLMSMKKDKCGSIHYAGQVDKRPVDGSFNRLVVIDNTQNTCPHLHFVALAPTEVEHTLITSGFGAPAIKAVSKMTGDRLN